MRGSMRPMMVGAVAAALTGAGCNTDNTHYAGYDVTDYFPLEGTRSWLYAQDDEKVLYQLQVEKLPETQRVDDMEIITLESSRSDSGALVQTMEWSSDPTHGVLIHSYEDAKGSKTTFVPPIVFGENGMQTDVALTTDTDAGSFSSTLLGVEGCVNHWVPDGDWSCLHMHLEGTGMPFEGDYWIATMYGVSWFQTVEDNDKWNLLAAEFEDTEL